MQTARWSLTILVATLGCGAPAEPEAARLGGVALPTEAFPAERSAEAPAAPAVEAPTAFNRAPSNEAPTAPEEAPRRALPDTCASDRGDLCTPPDDFVERLCRSAQPDVALALFKKGTPWTRAWVRQPMEAWYASGARSRPMQLRYAEEVIIVAARSGASKSAVQVSGSGSYDVVRWDGSCVSLMSGELALRYHGTPDVAEIPWKHLDDDIKQRLMQDERIARRNDKRLEACKGGVDERRCEEARLGLSRTIADYVRAGGEVPPPKVLP